ncbi:MAG: phospholipase D-like domain-containing protein [Planctomycetota bacterium]
MRDADGDLTFSPQDLDADGVWGGDRAVRGEVELIADAEHLPRVVQKGMLSAKVSLDIATADFKAMLVPDPANPRGRNAPSIVDHLLRLAKRGVEVRVLHAGVPSGPALQQLKKAFGGNPPRNPPGKPVSGLTIRRCPRLHAKAVVVDAGWLYLGSANLTGAGLGAKGAARRNFEWGVVSETPGLVDAVMGRFNTLWEGGHCAGCGRREVCPVPLEEPRLYRLGLSDS